MTARHLNENGFSTVELLISLFIAAAFISTGYQLFSAVTKDGHEARLRAQAGSIASENLQLHKNVAPMPCAENTNAATLTIPASSLPSATGNVVYSCPYGVGVKTTRITVNIQYDNGAKTVQESLDVYRST